MLLGELKAAEPALEKIIKSDLPVKMAYRFHKILQKIAEVNSPTEETRIGLIKKYGDSQPDGSFKVSEEKTSEFTQEFRTLMETEIELDKTTIDSVSIEELDAAQVKLSVTDVSILINIGVLKEN